jgi:hypothetical protein
MSYAKALQMRFLFRGTLDTTSRGLFNSDLRLTTQIFACLSMLFSLPTLITNFNYIDEKTIPILYVVYTLVEFSGPILILVGATRLDFELCYTGTVIYSVFTILEMTVKLAFGIILGLVILPTSIYPPVAAIAYLYLTIFLIGWVVMLALRLYVNYIFFSFTKNLGLGAMYGERLIVPQAVIVSQPEVILIEDAERKLTTEEKIYPQTVPSKIIERETNLAREA